MVGQAAKGIATWLVSTPEGRATLVKAADMAQETAKHRKAQAKSNIGRPRGKRRGSGVKKGSRATARKKR